MPVIIDAADWQTWLGEVPASGDELQTLLQPEGVYKLGPGDQLNVTVFGADDLSGEFPVSDTGTAVLPLIGEVKAVGLTPRELEGSARSWQVVI
jgi:protein involved in polysaccharide export with SLBB domain